jgi:hypothetical protein
MGVEMMNYFDEGFNAYLNGADARSAAERLALNWIKYGPEVKEFLAGYQSAEKMDRQTR